MPKTSRRWRISIATSMSTATASRIAPCPACIPRARISRAARATPSYGAYTENSDDYQEVIDRLLVKWETARKMVCPRPRFATRNSTRQQILTIGSGDGACKEALDRLAKQNVGLNYCRVKSFPFTDAVREFIDSTMSSTSSNRIVTRSCARCLINDHRCRPEQAGFIASLQWNADQLRLSSSTVFLKKSRKVVRPRVSPDKPGDCDHELHCETENCSHPGTHRKTSSGSRLQGLRRYAVSTLCAGCGHDSVTAAIIQAVFELGM